MNTGSLVSLQAILNLDLTNFPCIFKQRVIDCFIQELYGNVNNSTVLEEYKYFKMALNTKNI